MNTENPRETSRFTSTTIGQIGGSTISFLSRNENSISVLNTYNYDYGIPQIKLPPWRIGLFQIRTTPELTALYEQIENIFIYHHDALPMPQNTPGTSVMKYTINRTEPPISGNYFLNKEEINSQLDMMGKIKLHVLEHGQAIEAIEPVVFVQQTEEGFLVRLDITNIGIRPTAIEGPNHWDARYDIPITFPVVVYIQREGNTVARFSLTTAHLQPGSRHFAETIDIPAQSKASIEFLVPYSAVTDISESTLPLPSGDYSVAGALRTRFARPSQIGGYIIESPTIRATEARF